MMCCSRLCKFLVVVIVSCVTMHQFVTGSTTELPRDSDTTTMFSFLTRDHISRMHQRYITRQEIRNKVLEFFGWTSVPQIRPGDRARINSTLANISSFRVTERQCFYASCDLPNRIDENMWNDSTSGSLRLRFDVLPSESSASPEIVNATLMLHLKERDLRNTERILIKVLQYLKPLRRRNRSRGQPNRRNSIRQRILWTSLVDWTPGAWVSIPVQQAANDWIALNKRNHGFEVLVFDEFDNPINTSSVFSSIDCDRPAEVDCMEITHSLPLYRSATPVLQVYKTEAPFSGHRRKRDVYKEAMSLRQPEKSRQRIAGLH
ncbi:uncharacterized protein LOC125666703 isoform X2 [Ostrea edulis]|uniref:uncharacterized protein LOC125666703 isoform X2 n=1 Tax=Ostrea edulis TaxID=37623 RepID=UPI00209451C3|nr:uncharacterized protein LOC125666703 isoform X2 [Ostrea edulis]